MYPNQEAEKFGLLIVTRYKIGYPVFPYLLHFVILENIYALIKYRQKHFLFSQVVFIINFWLVEYLSD